MIGQVARMCSMFYKFRFCGFWLLILLTNFAFAEGVPKMINFQGRVNVGGSPLTAREHLSLP